MSAINTVIKRESVHLITDAASYDSDGNLIDIRLAVGAHLCNITVPT